jgi:phosphatidylglycerophosphate synthase
MLGNKDDELSWLRLAHGKASVSTHLLVSAAFHLVLLGGVLILGARLLAAVLPLSWRGFVVSIGCYAIVTAMVITALSRHAPHNDFGAANSVTLTRAALTALLWGASAELAFGNILSLDEQALWVLVLVATAALLSDGVDGWAARRSGMASDFGAHFDMEVDALFLLALSFLVLATGKVGAWVIASGFLRYGFVLSGYLRPQLAEPLMPRFRRKIICVVQMTVLIVALAPIASVMAAEILCFGGLMLLAYSFAVDFVWLVSRRTGPAFEGFPRRR